MDMDSKGDSAVARIRELVRHAREFGQREPIQIRMNGPTWALLEPELAKLCTYKVTEDSPFTTLRWEGAKAKLDGAPVFVVPDMQAAIEVSTFGDGFAASRPRPEDS